MEAGGGLLEDFDYRCRMPILILRLSWRREDIAPQVTWGTSPEMVAAVTEPQYPCLDEQPN